MKFSQFRHLILIAIIIIASQEALPDDNKPGVLALDEGVAKVIAELDYKPPKARLKRLDYRFSTGITKDTPVTGDYEIWMPNIWGIRSITKLPNASSQTISLSVCGMIDLAATSSSEIGFDLPVSVAINKAISLFNVRSSVNSTAAQKTTSLILGEGAKKICAPESGDVFNYEYRSDSESKSSALFGNRTRSYAFRMRCVVGDAKPIADLIPGQSGDYLPVACSGENLTTNMIATGDYAFLQSAGLYINLNRHSSAFTMKAKISSVAYE